MAVGIDGATVLLLVESSPGSGTYTAVGAQTGLSRDNSRNMIEMSNKDHDHTRWIYGKEDGTITLDALYVPNDAGMQAIRNAQSSKDKFLVRRSEDGTEIEEATVLVDTVSDDWPDNDASTVSVTLQLDSSWVAVP